MAQSDSDVLSAYIRFKSNPEYDTKQDAFFCQKTSVDISDLKRIKRDNPQWARDALDLRRKKYAEGILKVDAAMFRAAQQGDTKAADLLYRRFDGWNPKMVEQTNNFYNFADMVEDLKKKARVKQSQTKVGGGERDIPTRRRPPAS